MHGEGVREGRCDPGRGARSGGEGNAQRLLDVGRYVGCRQWGGGRQGCGGAGTAFSISPPVPLSIPLSSQPPSTRIQPRSHSVPPSDPTLGDAEPSMAPLSQTTLFSSRSPDLISSWRQGKMRGLFMKGPGREWDGPRARRQPRWRKRLRSLGGLFLEAGGLFPSLFHLRSSASQNHIFSSQNQPFCHHFLFFSDPTLLLCLPSTFSYSP